MKIDGWLSTAAEAVPHHLALVADDDSRTYGELDQACLLYAFDDLHDDTGLALGAFDEKIAVRGFARSSPSATGSIPTT